MIIYTLLHNDAITGTLLGHGRFIDGNYYFKHKNVDLVSHINNIIPNGEYQELQSDWFNGESKKLPSALELNPRIIAYWFMDSGAIQAKRKEILLRTKDFNKEDVWRLVDKLGDLGVKANVRCVRKKLIIEISHRSFFDFIKLIEGHVIDSLKFKIDTNGASLRDVSKYQCNKLNYKTAQDIRNIYQSGKFTQKEIAECYDITVLSVWRVINNITYPVRGVRMSGSAEVLMILKS